jgi:hypothetical protein
MKGLSTPSPGVPFWLDPKRNQKVQGLTLAFSAGGGQVPLEAEILFVCGIAPRTAISLPSAFGFRTQGSAYHLTARTGSAEGPLFLH